MRFDLTREFPLLTTKKVFFKGVVEELLWFIKGSTDSNLLSEKGVKIWDVNGSREYLSSIGLPEREQGDLGPVYGFQWRHFGAEYKDKNSNYENQGIDQLSWVINQIRTNPSSRRIIINSWNVKDIPKMALPPCHVMCQFIITSDNKLNCILYQRSADVGLGIPFNIASYSLLTCMISSITNLTPGEFVHHMGDTHIYKEHILALQEQIKRKPYSFPSLKIRKRNEIDEFTFEDFELINYRSHPRLEMKLIV